ncbi:Calmodulin-binding_protein [Hexamita inflata]|uniref:Calmodulin-binding protein n=1 Tax=Hexamita inflata TaxID=28002 RepID=A0AA86U721_9EUKA|nr:Calmodulin-binding protein [Hexamita inflata]
MDPRHHHTHSNIGAMLDPTKDSYCTQKNIPIRNRIGDQKANLQQLEEKNRQKKEEEEEKNNQERYCLQQFKNVKPKVWDAVEDAKAENPHTFKRREAGVAISNVNVPKGLESSYQPSSTNSSRKNSARPEQQQIVSKIDCKNTSYQPPKPTNTNYFQQNIKNMRENQQEIQTKNIKPEPKQEKLGVVPEYLKNRKQEWQDERDKEELRREMDAELAKIPPGTRPVGDEERAQLLKDLKVAYDAEIKKFNSFRLQSDNQSAIRAKNESQDKIAQLEKTIRDFQRPGPLYIAIDE